MSKSKPIRPIPNYLHHTEIKLFEPSMMDFWNNKEFHEYTEEEEDDPNFITVQAYHYVMIGDVKPLSVPEYDFFEWNRSEDSVQQLREFLWSGIRKLPHWWYDDSYFMFGRAPKHHRWTRTLALLGRYDEKIKKCIRKPLILISREKYRPHAEVLFRAINLLQHLEFLVKHYHKTMIVQDKYWLNNQMRSLGIDW